MLAINKADNLHLVKVKMVNLVVQTMTMAVAMAIIQLFLVFLVLIIQFILKFHKHHLIVKLNNCPAIMPMLRLSVKCFIFVL